MIAVQKSFSAGMDQVNADTVIDSAGYQWLVNGRQRYGYIQPIQKHIEDDNAPSGKKQGIFTVGNIVLLFVAGQAFVKKDTDVNWVLIPNFSLDPIADFYYIESVPASTFNFGRKLNADGNIKSPIVAQADVTISGTPQAIVVQDGIHQPWVILFNSLTESFYARPAGSFNTWQNNSTTQDDREYVPIGRQMMYKDAILYIVAPDGMSIYHSITGRPLDFMVNVDVNGNKLASELLGGAATVSFAFDFKPITCIFPINVPGSFAYCTDKNVRIVSIDTTNLYFGEPNFSVSALIEAGVVNQFSFTEILGDYAFIDFENVKSFNAVQLLKFEGRNADFSRPLARILKDIKQQHCCVITFDNYAMFCLDTRFGNCIAIYDTINKVWVGLDITEATLVKQFAIATEVDKSYLFCITRDDKVFQMFGDSLNTYIPILKTRSYVGGKAFLPGMAIVASETMFEHQSEYFRPMFQGGTYAGIAELLELVDEQVSQDTIILQQALTESFAGVNYPVRPPVYPSNKSRIDNPSFVLKDGLLGKKITYILKWNTDAKLVEFEAQTSEQKAPSSAKQRANVINDVYNPPQIPIPGKGLPSARGTEDGQSIRITEDGRTIRITE